jgi:hypothetical protein
MLVSGTTVSFIHDDEIRRDDDNDDEIIQRVLRKFFDLHYTQAKLVIVHFPQLAKQNIIFREKFMMIEFNVYKQETIQKSNEKPTVPTQGQNYSKVPLHTYIPRPFQRYQLCEDWSLGTRCFGATKGRRQGEKYSNRG